MVLWRSSIVLFYNILHHALCCCTYSFNYVHINIRIAVSFDINLKSLLFLLIINMPLPNKILGLLAIQFIVHSKTYLNILNNYNQYLNVILSKQKKNYLVFNSKKASDFLILIHFVIIIFDIRGTVFYNVKQTSAFSYLTLWEHLVSLK